MSATEPEATTLALLDEVVAGEAVEITRRGRVVARFVPAPGSPSLEGRLTGVAMTADSGDGLLSTGETWQHG